MDDPTAYPLPPPFAVELLEDAAPLARAAPADSPAERLARLRLIRSRRVGPVTWRRLMALHGNAVAALDALPDLAAQAGDARYAPAPESAVRDEGRAARALGARLVTRGDPDYPTRLMDLDDAPPVLWLAGDADLLRRPCVAVVGTRNASSAGRRMARDLARDLSRAGVAVVSGFARGIDAIAHDAALPLTVAVHAGGLDKPYPPENVDLAGRIIVEGLSLTERPFGHAPAARDFPRRNRIVSGLSDAVVVVEAATRSGSMITARDALDQGREVMAVPGHPSDARLSGCNALLRDGATLVRNAGDVLDLLDARPAAPAPEPPPDRVPAQSSAPIVATADDLSARLLDLLSATPVSEDQLARDADAAPHRVAAALSELELRGHVNRRPGGGLTRT
ncbi:DNA-processing protein DprA [Jannaschia sp. LMIT008]|uniref:DNA-processing protein DprA n=1 Tax=Jannaschia maritima TaxID=3032585 RepID=UPI00281217A9|nr:DNA-processing protein DprA [Jannaschia sp. LMIT008]